MIAEINPKQLLSGNKPRLIDEWQITPILWDMIRNAVDDSDKKGLYILTTSTVVDTSKINHSGIGRIHRLFMMSMSLYESGDSTGEISLEELFNNPEIKINAISKLTVEDLTFLSCRGGWSEVTNVEDKQEQLSIAPKYFETLCNEDISSIDGVKRDPTRVKYLLRAYSRNISTLTKNTMILADINSEYADIKKTTYYDYVDTLKRLFVIKDIYGWSPNLRSKNLIRKGTKKEFIDPSIATTALNLTPKTLLKDIKMFVHIFENLCIRDLTVYLESIGGSLFYYNDSQGLEADAVLVLDDSRYALIEIKLGSSEIEKGAKNLIKLKNLIEKRRNEGKVRIDNPTFLAVITGGKYAYTRKDGVQVIPIGCLKN